MTYDTERNPEKAIRRIANLVQEVIELKESNYELVEAIEAFRLFTVDNHGNMPVYLRPYREEFTRLMKKHKQS